MNILIRLPKIRRLADKSNKLQDSHNYPMHITENPYEKMKTIPSLFLYSVMSKSYMLAMVNVSGRGLKFTLSHINASQSLC